MATRYFIDESGNTGDLVRAGSAFDFGAQPIFCLACFGEDDEAGLSAAIDELKARHCVRLRELKAAKLYGKPAFIGDVVRLLAHRSAPVLVEVVQKRFMIGAYLVSHQLVALGDSLLGDSEGRAFARTLAEFVGAAAPDHVLGAFVGACNSPSHQAVVAALTTTRDWAAGYKPSFELNEVVRGLAQLGLDQIEASDEPDDAFSFRRFLPTPDQGPSGKPMWMLPSLSSFTNIYARINLSRRHDLSAVKILHDEQRYFEKAIKDGKAAAERLGARGAVPIAPFADYDFIDQAILEFGRSEDHVGLQVADVIAGFVTRHIGTRLSQGGRARAPLDEAFYELQCMTDERRGLGVNFVATERLLGRLGVRTSPA